MVPQIESGYAGALLLAVPFGKAETSLHPLARRGMRRVIACLARRWFEGQPDACTRLVSSQMPEPLGDDLNAGRMLLLSRASNLLSPADLERAQGDAIELCGHGEETMRNAGIIAAVQMAEVPGPNHQSYLTDLRRVLLQIALRSDGSDGLFAISGLADLAFVGSADVVDDLVDIFCDSPNPLKRNLVAIEMTWLRQVVKSLSDDKLSRLLQATERNNNRESGILMLYAAAAIMSAREFQRLEHKLQMLVQTTDVTRTQLAVDTIATFLYRVPPDQVKKVIAFVDEHIVNVRDFAFNALSAYLAAPPNVDNLNAVLECTSSPSLWRKVVLFAAMRSRNISILSEEADAIGKDGAPPATYKLRAVERRTLELCVALAPDSIRAAARGQDQSGPTQIATNGETPSTGDRVTQTGVRKGGRLTREEHTTAWNRMLELTSAHRSLLNDPSELARSIGISESTVRRWLKTMEERSRQRPEQIEDPE